MLVTTRAPYNTKDSPTCTTIPRGMRTSTLRRLHAPTALVDERVDWALVDDRVDWALVDERGGGERGG